ncbi:hypothetical protein [Pseudoroseicyclus sp. CXY001]|uniref:hypothetical protein n=1 Tax=Pseudoroseicyclus sp. CXY001 TaxID=3242492 RepID=UPI003570A9E1
MVTTADHTYTSATLERQIADAGARLEVVSWESLLGRRSLPGGTWLFTDFDRLAPAELHAAGMIAGKLKGARVRVVNDPRRYLRREQLINRLWREGLNSYRAWRPADGEWPDRFPVFLRPASGHVAPNRKLLESEEEARDWLKERLRRGDTLSDLVFIEYRGEPVGDPPYFSRYSAFRVGSAILRANTVNQDHWVVKGGQRGLASAEDYKEERREMDAYPHEAAVRHVFDVAGMEFGRLDFGVTEGRVETWEINTNPDMTLAPSHPDPVREEVMHLLRSRLAGALAALASPAAGRVDISEAYRRSKALRGRVFRS